MDEKFTHINEMIESISLTTCMLEEGDVPGMGEVINAMDELAERATDVDSEIFSNVINGLQNYLGRLVLNEITDVTPLEEGITALQSMWRDISRGQESDFDMTGVLKNLGVSAEIIESEIQAGQDSGMTEEDVRIFGEFIFESRENLETIELKLIELEHNPDDQDSIDAIFPNLSHDQGGSRVY